MSNTNCEENIKKLISEYNINGRVLLKFLNYTLYALFIMYVLSDFWHMYDKNNNKKTYYSNMFSRTTLLVFFIWIFVFFLFISGYTSRCSTN
jgi:hypothetical protein